MDATDVRLLAHLFRDPLASPAALGRTAGLTRNAVAARLARLGGEGVFQGVVGVPHPALLGRAQRVVVYPPMPAPPLDRVLEVPEVVHASVTHRDQLAAICHLAPGAEPPRALDRAMGAAPERTFVSHLPALQPPGAALSALEWRVMEALVPDPRAPAARLAEATGLAARTVARHRRRLVERHCLRLEMSVYAENARGVVLFEVYAQGKGALDRAALRRALGEHWEFDRTSDPPGVLVLASARGVGEAMTAERRVAALPGVEHAELILTRHGRFALDRLVAWCRDAGAAARERRAPAAG